MKALPTILLLLLFSMLSQQTLAGENDRLALTITDPFIELHTGPGERYPVFYVVDRGAKISVLGRKTQWFKVLTANGKQGWASKAQMQKTLLPSGEALRFKEEDRAAFVQRSWELGTMTGELKNAPLLEVYGGYAFTPNISVELGLAQSIGNVSSSNLVKLKLLMHPFPEWKYSPFFNLGAGAISVKPNATLIDPADKNNAFSQIGLGVKTWLSRRFVLRAQVNQMVIFSANTNKDENEELIEWKIGFAIFF